MKRTLDTIKNCASLSPANKRLGVQDHPIFTIEPDNVVIDELHMFMRIVDILIRNLVLELVNMDRRNRLQASKLRDLEASIRECGVTFRVWEKRDANGKPSNTYDWTSLKGSDMKKVLRTLPSHFPTLLRDEIRDKTANIWKVPGFPILLLPLMS